VGLPLAGLLFASTANAQEWLKDRRFSEGPGYRAGDLELHPGLGGEVGYDSNWFLRSDKTGPNIVNGAPNLPVRDGGVLRITPSLTVSTLGPLRNTGPAGEPPSVSFRGGVAATYREFIGGQELRDQRNLSAHADARVDILPQRPWSLGLFGLYDRTIQPTVLGNPDLSFNRDTLGAGAEVIATPNSGTLDWRLGYQVNAALFESSNGAPFNNVTHEVNTRGRWKFRPRTAFLYDATMRFLGYTQADRAVNALHDSTPVRARLGMSGLITPRVAFLGMAGWGASFYRQGNSPVPTQQYDSVIGQAELKFFPTANAVSGDVSDASLTLSSIALGYVRDYQNSYLGDFYGSDRGYAKIVYFFAGRALVSLEGGVGAIEYPDIYVNPASGIATNGQPIQKKFTDVRVDGTLFTEYRFLDSLGLNATFSYLQNLSNTQLPVPVVPGAAPQVYDLSWKRFQATLGLRWFL
jgi:hypothetical protein